MEKRPPRISYNVCSLLSPLKTSMVYHFLSVKSSNSFPCTASVDLLGSQQQSSTGYSRNIIFIQLDNSMILPYREIFKGFALSFGGPLLHHCPFMAATTKGEGQQKRKPYCLHRHFLGISLFESKTAS